MTRREMLEKARNKSTETNGTDNKTTQKGDIPQKGKGGEKVKPETVDIEGTKSEEQPEKVDAVKAFEERAKAAEEKAVASEKRLKEIEKDFEQLKEAIKRLQPRESEFELVTAQMAGKKTEPVGYVTKYAVKHNDEYVTAKTEEALKPLADLTEEPIKLIYFASYSDGSVSEEPATAEEVIALMKIRGL